jgi:hypothetical protein
MLKVNLGSSIPERRMELVYKTPDFFFVAQYLVDFVPEPAGTHTVDNDQVRLAVLYGVLVMFLKGF